MTDRGADWACLQARHAVHEVLDGTTADGGASLAHHLASCPACRDFAADLRAIQSGLRSLPRPALPDAALSALLARTSRAPAAPGRSWTRYRLAAAAAVVAALATSAWLWNRQAGEPAPAMDQAQLERAAEETRLVIGLAARALRRTETAAVRDVLGAEISRALGKVPIEWPEAPPAKPRRLQT